MTWGFPLTNPVPTEYYCGLVVNSDMNHRPVPSSLMPHQQRHKKLNSGAHYHRQYRMGHVVLSFRLQRLYRERVSRFMIICKAFGRLALSTCTQQTMSW